VFSLIGIRFFSTLIALFISGILSGANFCTIVQKNEENAIIESPIDSASCQDFLTDSLKSFVRFEYTDGAFSYYSIRLAMFNSSIERGYFYEAAKADGIYIADKSEFDNDSTLFFTGDNDKMRIFHLFYNLYNQTINSRPILSSTGTGSILQHSSPLTTSPTCSTAQVACSNNVYSYPAGTTGDAPPSVGGYPNYGCLGNEPAPAFFYMQVGTAGSIILTISESNNYDVDFICWGPFTNLTDGCATGLTGTCGTSPQPGCCSNNQTGCTNFYPRGNITDCSYSPLANETCHILNAQVGQIYILLITNYSRQPGTITLSQTGGTGLTNCNIVVFCSMIDLTATPSACNGLTNTFSISGNVDFSNPPLTGTMTITDNTAIPPVSQTFSAPFISPQAYNLPGIPCDGLVHTLTAAFSDSTNCTLSQQCTSPPESCPQAQISGGGEICNDGTSTVPVDINLTGTGPYNITYAINGVPQTPINNYPGPSPYVINTNTAGTYTLVSVSNGVCSGSGQVSGSATIILDPLPVVHLSGLTTLCAGTSGIYTTDPGNTNYQWTFSTGGMITSGGTLTDNSATVTWSIPGAQSISINYIDPKGCTAPGSTVLPVTINVLPAPTISGNVSVCEGTTGVSYTTQPGMTNYQWSVSGGGSITSGGGATDNTVTINWNIPGPQTVSVNYTNSNGCTANAPTVYPVTVNPLPGPAGLITGPTVLCQASTTSYDVGSVSNTNSYAWVLNPGTAGTIVGNTKSITVNWSAAFYGNADLTTQGVNTCGIGLISPALSILVNPKPLVFYTICTDSITTTGARPILLREGIPLGGTWSGTGVTPSSGTFNPATAGPGSFTITYSYTNVYGCINTASRIIIVTTPGVFTCGGNLKDVRDNKNYSTVLIGSQCWMAEDLNYGTEIPSSQDQRDNCIIEKYHNPASSIQHPASLYQWDEMMTYTTTSGSQGICPPAWHIPTEAEWTLLFSNYTSNGLAGNALKSTGYSGFNALLNGMNFYNRNFYFDTFAGIYWTSDSHGPFKAWSHGMNTFDPSVSIYPSARSNAFELRCIKD